MVSRVFGWTLSKKDQPPEATSAFYVPLDDKEIAGENWDEMINQL